MKILVPDVYCFCHCGPDFLYHFDSQLLQFSQIVFFYTKKLVELLKSLMAMALQPTRSSLFIP